MAGSTYNEEKVLGIIHNVTQALMAAFPNTSIYPSFGNHDPYPTNQMPRDNEHYYSSILNASLWNLLLPEGSKKTFLKGKQM